jgi:hypothetical protein
MTRHLSDRVSAVLRADHPWLIWNEDDEVLTAALRSAQHARRLGDFAGWVAARLGWTDPAPIWPPGVAFPLAPSDSSHDSPPAVGFVAFSDEKAPESTELVSDEMRETAETARQWWVSVNYRELGKTRIWVPRKTDGRSLGLASLLAGMVTVLQNVLPPGSRVRCPFAATGVLSARGDLGPVAPESLEYKLGAAWERGFRTVVVVSSAEDAPPRSAGPVGVEVVSVSTNPEDAVRAGLLHMGPLNRATRGFAGAFTRLANFLKIRGNIDWFLDFLLQELQRLPEPAKLVQQLSTDLAIDTSRYKWDAPPAELWKRLLDDYLRGPTKKKPSTRGQNGSEDRNGGDANGTPHDRLARLTYLALAHNPNSEGTLVLTELAAHFSREMHGAEMTALDARELLNNRQTAAAGSSQLEECIHAYSVIASVKRNERESLIWNLIDRSKDHRLLNHAIVAAVRFGFRPADLRRRVSEAWGSRTLPPGSLIHQRMRVECRVETLGFLEPMLRPHVIALPRAPVVEVCRYPVTNVDLECFDPSRSARRSAAARDDESPAVGVTWYEAMNFAFWAGLELPTALEWLSAAAPPSWNLPFPSPPFPDGRLDPQYATFGRLTGATPVRARGGASRTHCGCEEMFGNVWQWLADWFPSALALDRDDSPRALVDAKLAMGGGWNSEADSLALGRFIVLPVETQSMDVGFRCVRVPR